MRNGVLALGAILLLASRLPGQIIESEEPWANKLFKTMGPISHDFGVVPRGAQLKYTFKMKNIWKVPIQLSEVRVSCGCVTPSPDKRTLQPNEEGNLNVTMDTRRIPPPGAKTVTIYVTVGPEYVSTAMLRVSAVARQDVVFNPGTVNFGLVQRGESPKQVLDVEYSGTLDWSIKEVIKNASAPFKLEVEELYRERPTRFRSGKVGYRFHVTLKPDGPAGPFKQEILLKTNDPASPTLTAGIEGTIQASLSVAPENIRFDTVKVGKEKPQNVIISGKRAFRIVSVEGIGEGVSVDIPDRTAASHILTIHCQPQQAGQIKKRLLIRTDLDGESVPVNIEGSAVP